MTSQKTFFLISFLTVVFALSAQDKSTTFKLTDSSFKTGASLRTYSIIYLFGRCDLHEHSYQFLDSLVEFLKKNKAITLQINRHDFKPKPESSMHFANCRAQSIANYLINKGISKDRLSAKGYDGTQPLFSQERIDRAKTKEEKTKLMVSNLRVEFIITSGK